MFFKHPFKSFQYFTLSPNLSRTVDIPISTDPNNITTLAYLKVKAKKYDVIWLNATVGWQAGPEIIDPNLIFKIWADDTNTINGTLLFSAVASARASEYKITSFSHVECIKSWKTKKQTYFLTVEYDVTNPPTCTGKIIGPITFTASEIQK